MQKFVSTGMILGLVVIHLIGCSDSGPPAQKSTTAEPKISADGAKFLLASEPMGAAAVIKARETAKDDEEIVVVGRIGGSTNPWVDGRAAFEIVDQSLKACSDIPGDSCETPWDYCCETDKLPKAKAFIKVVDETGNPVKTDARELLNLKELQTVVVRGKAKRDEVGNLTVLASGIYVRK